VFLWFSIVSEKSLKYDGNSGIIRQKTGFADKFCKFPLKKPPGNKR
jgi:hypothetical protein